MKNLNQKHTATNTVFSAVTENTNEKSSIRNLKVEKQSNLKVVFQLTVLMLTLPIITAAFLFIVKIL